MDSRILVVQSVAGGVLSSMRIGTVLKAMLLYASVAWTVIFVSMLTPQATVAGVTTTSTSWQSSYCMPEGVSPVANTSFDCVVHLLDACLEA
jgi:hypothetical protein